MAIEVKGARVALIFWGVGKQLWSDAGVFPRHRATNVIFLLHLLMYIAFCGVIVARLGENLIHAWSFAARLLSKLS